MRSETIGSYSYDTNSSPGFGINQWGPSGDYEDADMMKLLNPGYSENIIIKIKKVLK